MGQGFTWETQDRERDIEAARAAWERGKQMIADPAFDFVLLDELNILLSNDYLPIAEIVETLAGRPVETHGCVKGLHAKTQQMKSAERRARETVVGAGGGRK